jgi:hypothetical protein
VGALPLRVEGRGRILLGAQAESAYAWTLQASSLVVNVTSSTRTEAVWPNSNQEAGFVYDSAPKYQEYRWGRVNVTGRSLRPSSNLLVHGLGSDPSILAHAALVELRPLVGAAWAAGASANAIAVTGQTTRSTYLLDLPRGWAQADLAAPHLDVQGDLRLALWENVVQVGPRGETFASGVRTQDSYPSPAGTGALVRQRNETLLVLTATDAVLTLHVASGSLRLGSDALGVAGELDATFRSAEGSIERGADRVAVRGEPVTVSGSMQLRTWNATTVGGLRGQFGVADATIGLPTRDLPAPFASIASPPPPAVSWLGWSVLALSILGLFIAWRARRSVTVDDVEWELLAGHVRRGHRMARRLVRAHPDDPDVVFLYASTLLARDRPEELVERVEPLAQDLPRPSRRGIAYVLAVAAKSLGDRARSRRWAEEASQEPLLLARMKADGLWPKHAARAEPAGYA